MKRSDINEHELIQVLEQQGGLAGVVLKDIDVGCACPVYKVESKNSLPIFIKIIGRRSDYPILDFLARCGHCDFLPQPAFPQPLQMGQLFVVGLTWLESVRVNAEDMTDNQLEDFVRNCRILIQALKDGESVFRKLPNLPYGLPEEHFAIIENYSTRHRLASQFLKPLLEIPQELRTYGGRDLVLIHGDLQPANYGFQGDRLAAVYDFDNVRYGLPCEDIVYAFTERARRHELSASSRARLTELFLRARVLFGARTEDWLTALNRARIRIAAKRISSRPNSAWIACDVYRRDRQLHRLAQALCTR